ncbi:MAG: 6-phosphogluconolactonase [bacterium]
MIKDHSQVRIFPDLSALSREAAEFFTVLCSDAVRQRKRFTAVLSGGSTPRTLYQVLASSDFRERIPWSCVHLFWGDERCVPPEHPDSNYRMAREDLLSRITIPPENIHRMPGEADPVQGAEIYDKELREFFKGPKIPEFDMIILGLGTDGHTASLFPLSSALKESGRLVVPVSVQNILHQRLTLTLPVINHARNILFLVAGREKARVLAQVLDEKTDPDRIPARAVRSGRGKVLWFADEDAASLLKRD